MTTIDALLADIKARTTEHDRLQRIMWDSIHELTISREQLIREHIQEAHLLDVCTWNLITDGSKISLGAGEYSSDKKVKKLTSLIESDFHCEFGLVVEEQNRDYRDYPGDQRYFKKLVSIRFDDGEIQIMFDSNSYVPGFIKNFGLKINVSGVDAKIANRQSSIDAMQAIKMLVEE